MQNEMQQLMSETKIIIDRFAAEVEPKKWNHNAEALELLKQLGSLCQYVLLDGHYKEGDAKKDDFMNECSDVLYMFFRICISFNLTLSKNKLSDYKFSKSVIIRSVNKNVEKVVLTMSEHMACAAQMIIFIDEGGNTCKITSYLHYQLLIYLERILPCLNYIAQKYDFDLIDAHRIELQKAKEWMDNRRN